MAASLGLKLYTLGQKRSSGGGSQRPARPAGALAWLHVPSVGQAGPIFALAQRLVEEDGMSVVLTCPEPLDDRDQVMTLTPPPDSPAEARAFLDHWRPNVAVFADGELRPAILHEAAERGIPLFLVNARAPHFLRERDAWYPGLLRSALAQFAHIGAVDETAARSFRKAGAALSAVAVTGRMVEDSATLPCVEAERAALARLLATRPVWFAASVPPQEVPAVVAAHRASLQQSHRLLLILTLSDPATTPALAQQLEDVEGWAVAQRMQDEDPEAEVEVLIADNPAEHGLWYRLAPVTYLGGSLLGDGPLCNPMEAAALGSAILHGSKAGRHAAVLGRLAAARATRAVASAADLREALSDLLAPDRAARLAHAAWGVASDGADVTERLVLQIRQAVEAAP
jgi:3-deoxy-D-manno-octulosonic-acid transferase